MFPIVPSYNIAQVGLLHWTKKPPELKIEEKKSI